MMCGWLSLPKMATSEQASLVLCFWHRKVWYFDGRDVNFLERAGLFSLELLHSIAGPGGSSAYLRLDPVFFIEKGTFRLLHFCFYAE